MFWNLDLLAGTTTASTSLPPNTLASKFLVCGNTAAVQWGTITAFIAPAWITAPICGVSEDCWLLRACPLVSCRDTLIFNDYVVFSSADMKPAKAFDRRHGLVNHDSHSMDSLPQIETKFSRRSSDFEESSGAVAQL